MASTDYCSTKDLWYQLSASVLLVDSEVVGEDLQSAKSQIQLGLMYYKKSTSNPESCEEAKKYSDKGLDALVSEVGKLLKLNKNVAHEILSNYLSCEFRGAGKSIEDYLDDVQLRRSLMRDIWLNFLREQVFLLHCMKHILAYTRPQSVHPHKEHLTSLMNSISKPELLETLILQAEELTKEKPPTKADLEFLDQTMVEQWLSYNIWCQILTAQIIFELSQTHPISPKAVERLFVIYRIQNFGWNPSFQLALTDTHRDFLKMMTASHVSLLVHIIMQEANLDEELMISERAMVAKLKDHIHMLDVHDNHGLLMLAYSVTFYIEKEDNSSDLALIEKAMKVNQFPILYKTLMTVKQMNDPSMEDRIFQVMQNLLTKLLSQYNIMAFCNFPMFHEVFALLLSNSACNASFLADPASSLNEILAIATEYFPYFKPPLLLLVASFSKSNPEGLTKILEVVGRLDIFTEEISPQPIDVIRRGEQLILKSDHILLDGTLKIPAGTVGVTSQLPTPNPLVHWNTHYNFWDVVCAEQKKVIAAIRSGQPHDLGHSALLLNCIYEVLKGGWHGDRRMTSAIQEVFELVQCFCQMSNPPLDLLAIAMRIFTVLADKHCENVCNSVSSIKLVPSCRLQPNRLPSLTVQVDYGIFDYVLTQFDCDDGKSQFIQAYIEFILEIIKHEEVPSGIVVAGIVTVNECIFPSHNRWQYATLGDGDELGVLCLKLFQTLLSPLKDTPKAFGWQKLCLESLLLSKASPILLEVATTSEAYIELLMVEQSSFLSGRLTILQKKVQLSLSLLNLVLQKKHLILGNCSDCYLLQQISTCRQSQDNNFYKRLTNYLHTRFNPCFPTLAMKVLQKIFELIPISLHSYMGKGDNYIRQTFELRLVSRDDYPPLRVAIIDTIATCVRTGTQSALLEVLFTNEDAPKKALKDVTENDLKSDEKIPPILEYLLGVLNTTREEPEKVSNAVYTAVINMINTCWEKPKYFLRAKMESHKGFWKDLCAPLHVTEKLEEIPVYGVLFRIISLELLKDTESEDLCAELEAFMKEKKDDMGNNVESTCETWNKHVLGKMVSCINEGATEENKPIIKSWSTFLVMILKKKGELLPVSLLAELTKAYLTSLMECLQKNFEGPCVNLVAQVLLHLIIKAKDADLGTNFTHQITRLLQEMHLKYVYVPLDSRTLIMAIITKGMTCESFSVDEIGQGQEDSDFVLSLSEILLNEVLYVPALTKGHRGSPMLYCCVYQFLKLAYEAQSSNKQSLERIGSTNTLASVMRNATKLIKGREDAMCAEVALNVLVAASKITSLVHYLIIGELCDLFQALTVCKERVTQKQEIEWDGVYSQGVILSTNLVTESWLLALPAVTNFVVDHRPYLVSFLMFLRRRQDRHALLMAMQISKLLNKVCNDKATWQYTHTDTLQDLTHALQVCVDLCILFLTRPKISLGVQPVLPFPFIDFKHPAEKNNLLLKIAGLCLDCLSKITSPEMTCLQEFIQLADDRRQIQVISNTLKAGPYLARDYQPTLSFGHLNDLSSQCVQMLFEPQRSSPGREVVVINVHSGIAKATLNKCLQFTMTQAKARIQLLDNPADIAKFRCEIYHEMAMILGNVKYKLSKRMKRSSSSDIASASTSGLQSRVVPRGTLGGYTGPYICASASSSFIQ